MLECLLFYIYPRSDACLVHDYVCVIYFCIIIIIIIFMIILVLHITM